MTWMGKGGVGENMGGRTPFYARNERVHDGWTIGSICVFLSMLND